MENQKHNKDPALAKQPLKNFVFMAVFFFCFKKLFLLICCWYIMFLCMNFNVCCVEIRNTWSLQLFWCSFSCTYCIPRTVRAFPKFKNHAHISNSRACFCMGHFVWFCNKKHEYVVVCINVLFFKFCCVAHQTYMHIAIVLVLFLLNILYLVSCLMPFMTYCKMLVFSKKGNIVLLNEQNSAESERQVNHGSYMKTEWCHMKPHRMTWDWLMNQIKATHSISTCN